MRRDFLKTAAGAGMASLGAFAQTANAVGLRGNPNDTYVLAPTPNKYPGLPCISMHEQGVISPKVFASRDENLSSFQRNWL